MPPRPIPKKLGRNAVVSATLNYIRPTSHWKDIFPNNYRQTRLKFIVKDLLMDASSKRVLKLFHQDYPDKIFSAFVASVKLEKSGPPNQLFLNDGRETSPAASASLNVNDAPDDDEDPEPVDDDADNMAEGEEGTPDANPPLIDLTEQPWMVIGAGLLFFMPLRTTQEALTSNQILPSRN